MKRSSWGLTVATLGALAAIALVLLPFPDNPVRAGVTIIFAVAAPGYALTEAILGQQPLDMAKRIALALGLSLCAIIFTGLVLNLTPWGLTQGALALALAAITLVASGIAALRNYLVAGEPGQAVLPAARHPQGPRRSSLAGMLARWQVLLVVAALALTGVAVAFSVNSAAHQPYGGYTALWLLPSKSNPDLFIELGVRNEENRPVRYRLTLKGGSTTIKTWEPLSLAQGQTWQTTVKLPRPASLMGPVTASLYRLDAPTKVYRYVVYHSGALNGGSGAGGPGAGGPGGGGPGGGGPGGGPGNSPTPTPKARPTATRTAKAIATPTATP